LRASHRYRPIKSRSSISNAKNTITEEAVVVEEAGRDILATNGFFGNPFTMDPKDFGLGPGNGFGGLVAVVESFEWVFTDLFRLCERITQSRLVPFEVHSKMH
jgi:hypothetical protein